MLYGEALEIFDPASMPRSWARVQRNLGNALVSLGDQRSDPEHYEQALRAYRAALRVYTPEEHPHAWADTHRSIGEAAASLGQLVSDRSRLEKSVEAYLTALVVYLVLQTQFQAEAYQACSRQLEGLSRRLREQREATAAPGKEKR